MEWVNVGLAFVAIAAIIAALYVGFYWGALYAQQRFETWWVQQRIAARRASAWQPSAHARYWEPAPPGVPDEVEHPAAEGGNSAWWQPQQSWGI